MLAPQFSQKGRGGGEAFRRREKNRRRGGSSTAVTAASAATMSDCSSIEGKVKDLMRESILNALGRSGVPKPVAPLGINIFVVEALAAASAYLINFGA
jgi:hypothetical protein